jgi:regulator of sigma E protease
LFLESIPVGIKKENQVVGYGKQLKMIFSPSTGLQTSMVLKPYLISFQVLGWETFWTITALLSIMLGVMNLPIPALDGGHVMFIV